MTHSLLIKQIDEPLAATDNSQEIESSYTIPKQSLEVRRFKTKKKKELNTVKKDFRKLDICNKHNAEQFFLLKHF